MFLIYIYLIWTILNYTNSCFLPNFSIRHIKWVKCRENKNEEWSSKPNSYSVPYLHICKVKCEEGFYSYYSDKEKKCRYNNYFLEFQCISQTKVKGCIIIINRNSHRKFLGSYLRINETEKYSCQEGYHKPNDNHPLICDDPEEQQFIYVRCKANKFNNSLQRREKKGYCNSGDFIERNLKLIKRNHRVRGPVKDINDRTDVFQLIYYNYWPECANGSELAIYTKITCLPTSELNQLNQLRCFDSYEIKHNTVCKFPDSSEKSSLMIKYIYYDDINIKESNFYGLYIDDRTFNYTCVENAEIKKEINNNTARCVNDKGIKKIIPENYGCVCKPNYKYNSDNSMCVCDDGYIKVDDECKQECVIPDIDDSALLKKKKEKSWLKLSCCHSNGTWVTDELNENESCVCNPGSTLGNGFCYCDDGYLRVEHTCKKTCSRTNLDNITLLDKSKFIQFCLKENLLFYIPGGRCNFNICLENSHQIDNMTLSCNSNGEWVTNESNGKDLCACNKGYTYISGSCKITTSIPESNDDNLNDQSDTISKEEEEEEEKEKEIGKSIKVENPQKIIPPSRNNKIISTTTNELNSNHQSHDDSNDQSDTISKEEEEDKKKPKPIKEEIIDTSIQNNSSTTISSSTESTNQSSNGIEKYAFNIWIRVSITILLYYWY